MTHDRLVPVRQRPPSWARALPYDWRSREAIAGVSRCRRPSRVRRAVEFAGGVLLALALLYEINLAFSPDLWAALLGR